MGLKPKKITKGSVGQASPTQKPLKSKRKMKNVSSAAKDQLQDTESLMTRSCPVSKSCNPQTKSNLPAQQKRSWKRLPRPSATSLDQILKLSFKRHHSKKEKKKGIANDNKPLKAPVTLPLRENEQQSGHNLEPKSDPEKLSFQFENCCVESKNHRFECQYSEPSSLLNSTAVWPQGSNCKTLPSITRKRQNKRTGDRSMSVDDFNNNSSTFSEKFNELRTFPKSRKLLSSSDLTRGGKCTKTSYSKCANNSVANPSSNCSSPFISSSKFSPCSHSPEEREVNRTSCACKASSDKEPVSKSVLIESLHFTCKPQMQAEPHHDDSSCLNTKLSSDATEDSCGMVWFRNPTQSPYRQANIPTDNTDDNVTMLDHMQTSSICRPGHNRRFQNCDRTQSDLRERSQSIRQTKSSTFLKTDFSKDVVDTSLVMSDLLMDSLEHDTGSVEEDDQSFDAEKEIQEQAGTTTKKRPVFSKTSNQNQFTSYKEYSSGKHTDDSEELSLSKCLLSENDSKEDDFKNQVFKKTFTDFNDSESILSFDERKTRHSPNTSTCSIPSMVSSTGLDTNSVSDIHHHSSIKKPKTYSSSLKSPSLISTNRGSTSWLKNRSFFLRVTESRRKQHKREWEKTRAAPVCHRFSSHSQHECDLNVDDITNELQTAKTVITAQNVEIDILRQKVQEVQNDAQEEEYLRTEAEVNRVNAEHESRLLKATIRELRELLNENGGFSRENKFTYLNSKLECLGDRSMAPGSISKSWHCYNCQTQSGDTLSKPISRELCDQGYFSIPRQSGDLPFSPRQSPTVLATPLTGLAQSTGFLFQHHKSENTLKLRCEAEVGALMSSHSNVASSTTDVGCQTATTCKCGTSRNTDKKGTKLSSMEMEVLGNVAIVESGKEVHFVSRLAVCFAQVFLTVVLLECHEDQKLNIERMVIHHVIPSWKQLFK